MRFFGAHKAENTAPGPDKITYSNWRSLDPEAINITRILNICLKFRKILPEWKKSITILIFKKDNKADPGNWRPTALSNTIFKLYAGCLANRMSSWIETNNVLSQCQKGFRPYDGVFEHNFILRELFNKSRKNKSELCLAWLDIANAFGSIPHTAITTALLTTGAGTTFVEIINDMYTNSSTAILLEQGPTTQIPILAGVRQGCPISGLLFNLTIDPILRKIQNDSLQHRILTSLRR